MIARGRLAALAIGLGGLAAIVLLMCEPDEADGARAVNGAGLGAGTYASALQCTVAPFLGAGAFTHCLADYEMQPDGGDFTLPDGGAGPLLAVSEWSNLGWGNTNDSGLCFDQGQVTYDTTCDATTPGACIKLAVANGDAAVPCQMDWDAAAADATPPYVTQRTLSGEIQERAASRAPPFAIEIQWQMPNGPGTWPYAMASYTTECQSPNLNAAFGNGFSGIGNCVYNNAGYTEIDMSERQHPSYNFDYAIHAPTCANATSTIFSGIPSDFGVGWHTSTVVVSAASLPDGGPQFGEIDFYVDGALVTAIPENDGGAYPDGASYTGCGYQAGRINRAPEFFTAGVNFGGSAAGGPNTWAPTDLPQQMRIRYIRIACHWNGVQCVP